MFQAALRKRSLGLFQLEPPRCEHEPIQQVLCREYPVKQTALSSLIRTRWPLLVNGGEDFKKNYCPIALAVVRLRSRIFNASMRTTLPAVMRAGFFSVGTVD